MSEDLKRTESEIRSRLETVRRKPDKNAHELVELLESVPKLNQKFNISCEPNRIKVSEEYKPDQIRYQKFCRAYMIYVFNHFIVEADDVEIMLVAFNYHPDFKHEPRPNYRRALYARQVYEPKHPEKHWGKSVDAKSRGLYNEEARIMIELSKVLAAWTADHNGKLNIMERVLTTLESPETEESAVGEVQPATSMEDIEPGTSEENTSTDGVEKNPQPVEPDIDPTPGESEAPPPQPQQPSKIHRPPVEELFPTAKEITLIPGGIAQLKVAILPGEAIDAPLSFVSLDPSIITVSTSGMLKAEKKPQKLLHNIKNKRLLGTLLGRSGKLNADSQTVEIIVQAESGVTASKLVIVDYSRGSCKSPVADINDFVPSFNMSQQVRIVGSKDWATAVDAKVGDEIEFWIQYRNTSSENQEDVMIRDVLPISLRYVAGTTKLWNDHLDGAVNNEDTIATTGINIGHYGPNANAHIRFQVEVVEDFLACGGNTLFNWSQIYAGNVTLQDYTAVKVNKS